MPLGFYVSNWQKVQLNTDLLKNKTRYFYTNRNGLLKLNEIKLIRKLIKKEMDINFRGCFCLKTGGKNTNREFLGLSPNLGQNTNLKNWRYKKLRKICSQKVLWIGTQMKKVARFWLTDFPLIIELTNWAYYHTLTQKLTVSDIRSL